MKRFNAIVVHFSDSLLGLIILDSILVFSGFEEIICKLTKELPKWRLFKTNDVFHVLCGVFFPSFQSQGDNLYHLNSVIIALTLLKLRKGEEKLHNTSPLTPSSKVGLA